MASTHYDAVIIGAGQAGGPLAGDLARDGRRTLLIERAQVGGTCINRGCTPTKTMIASARVAHLARLAGEYGVRAGAVGVDLAAVRERKDGIVESFREGSERRIRDAGVELRRGEAMFVGPRALSVRTADGGHLFVTGELIFINTGTRPARPDLDGLGEVEHLDSTSIMQLDELPRHLLVLGGGYVGVEFAQMFRRFGSRVTVVQRGSRLLNREDRDIADELAEILRGEEIELHLDADALRVGRAESDSIHLEIAGSDGAQMLIGSHLLVATGREPNSGALNLDAAGVATDERGYVEVNERLQTSAPGVYAMGDVTGAPAFTHISYDDYRVLRAILLEDSVASTTDRMVPYVVFTDPQLGRVGLSEEDARREGRRIGVARMPMTRVARAVETGETRGMMKAIVSKESGAILGCAVLGAEGGELMAMLQVAMMAGLPYTALRDGVFAHPTLAESLNNLFSDVRFDEASDGDR